MKSLKHMLLVVILIAFSSCKDKADAATTSEIEEAARMDSSSSTYSVNINESTINWKGFKPTGTHTGTILIQEGSISANENGLESGYFVINMKSINVTDIASGEGKESLESHLMGTVEGKEGDFFNVNQYPTAKFEITGYNASENSIGKLSGNLTLKGKTQNISFPVSIYEEGDKITLKSDSFTIDRTKWGITYGSKSFFDNLGDKFINDDMELQILVIATKA